MANTTNVKYQIKRDPEMNQDDIYEIASSLIAFVPRNDTGIGLTIVLRVEIIRYVGAKSSPSRLHL